MNSFVRPQSTYGPIPTRFVELNHYVVQIIRKLFGLAVRGSGAISQCEMKFVGANDDHRMLLGRVFDWVEYIIVWGPMFPHETTVFVACSSELKSIGSVSHPYAISVYDSDTDPYRTKVVAELPYKVATGSGFMLCPNFLFVCENWKHNTPSRVSTYIHATIRRLDVGDGAQVHHVIDRKYAVIADSQSLIEDIGGVV